MRLYRHGERTVRFGVRFGVDGCSVFESGSARHEHLDRLRRFADRLFL